MIGERLKEERERLGYTQPVFAKAAGAAKRTLIEWEKGNTSTSAVQLSALMAIGVDVLYILTGQRSSPPVIGEAVREMGVPGHAVRDTGVKIGDAVKELGLSRREQALLANYRGSDEEGRKAMEATASALAHKDSGKKKRQGGE